MKTNFHAGLPKKKDINEIINKLLGRNPRLLDIDKEGYLNPRDLCLVVTTMYVAGNYNYEN